MSRSPLAYPLNRGDFEAGGAADLQTDVMRFMAILALCLLAIFALVQSIPLAPQPQTAGSAQAARTEPPRPAAASETSAATDAKTTETVPATSPSGAEKPVTLNRPKWVPAYVPAERPAAKADAAPVREEARDEGFTLRFESDLALTRLVAAGQVGFYALGNGRSQRMAVSDSRIVFWQASTPNAFHEMETATVPQAVVDALSRTGMDVSAVRWGVTLPGGLRNELDALIRKGTRGALIIGIDGELRLETS